MKWGPNWKQYLKSGKLGTQALSVCFSLPPPSLFPYYWVSLALRGMPLPTISSLHVNLTCFLLNDSLFPEVVVSIYVDLSFLMTASGLWVQIVRDSKTVTCCSNDLAFFSSVTHPWLNWLKPQELGPFAWKLGWSMGAEGVADPSGSADHMQQWPQVSRSHVPQKENCVYWVQSSLLTFVLSYVLIFIIFTEDLLWGGHCTMGVKFYLPHPSIRIGWFWHKKSSFNAKWKKPKKIITFLEMLFST